MATAPDNLRSRLTRRGKGRIEDASSPPPIASDMPSLSKLTARQVAVVRAVDYPRMILALGLGTAGGAALNWLNMPLAWMIGAMLTTSVAAIAGVRLKVPKGLRSLMVMVLGIMLGSAFSPDIVGHLGRWTVTLAGLVPYIALCTAVGMAFLRWVAKWDSVTAYFTATPGGFNEMVMMGSQLGGDEKAIALSHSARIMLVIFTIPVWFRFLDGYDAAARGGLGPALTAVAPLDYLMLALCIVGAPIAGALRIPAGALVGPMVLSAIFHLAGLTEGSPPALAIAAAQVVVGAFIGCRFAGTTIRGVAVIGATAIGLTLCLLSITVAFALLMHALTGIGISELVLAYAPGGLAEMSLVAIALGADAAFVSTHHIARIILIVVFAPGLFLMLRRRRQASSRRSGRPSPHPGD